MSYDIEKMSRDNLNQLLLVLENIRIERGFSSKRYFYYETKGLKGVSTLRHSKIINNFVALKIIKERSFMNFIYSFFKDTEGIFAIKIGKNSFSYYAKAKLELEKRSNKQKIVRRIKNSPDFNSGKSILYFGGKEIKIQLRNRKPNAHYVLKYIFNSKKGLSHKYTFEELDDYAFKSLGNYSWKKAHHACENIQEKVRKATGIDDFLIFTSGESGWVKINEKYLE